jgi:hypothetical protein
MSQRGVVLAAIGVGFLTGLWLSVLPDDARAGSCPVEAAWIGTSGDNTKLDTDDGVDEENQWWAREGMDFLRSLACDDIDVHGEGGGDDVGGGSGDDNVYGEENSDEVYGGQNGFFSDDLFGGAGIDQLFDLEADDDDNLEGGTDNDTLDTRDGDGLDSLNGNGGTDDCLGNTGDSTFNCE